MLVMMKASISLGLAMGLSLRHYYRPTGPRLGQARMIGLRTFMSSAYRYLLRCSILHVTAPPARNVLAVV